MSAPRQLLVSHCNAPGGLTLVDLEAWMAPGMNDEADCLHLLYDGDVRGVCRAGDRWFGVNAAGELLAIDLEGRQVQPSRQLPGAEGAHDLKYHEGHFYVAAVKGNCIIRFTPDGEEVDRFTLLPPTPDERGVGQDDTHLNSFCLDGDRVYFSHFSSTREPRRTKRHRLTWKRDGFLRSMAWDEGLTQLLAHPLRQPHSLQVHDGTLWFVESFAGTVRTLDLATGLCTSVFETRGYPRGLVVDLVGGQLWLGVSAPRRSVAPDPTDRSELLRIELSSGEVTHRLALPAPESYDVVSV